MAMVSPSGAISRRETIATVISAELERQARDGAIRVDVDALADAIEAAIGGPADIAEGRHPDELNATNDD